MKAIMCDRCGRAYGYGKGGEVGMNDCEKVIKGLEACSLAGTKDDCIWYGCPYLIYNDEVSDDCQEKMFDDAITLLKAREPMQNGEQYQCNRCKYYEGVHNTKGHAPCSFLNIGVVMWNDYCSRFQDFRIGGEAE